MACYFIVTFMPPGPKLNWVPDSWPSFFKITMVTAILILHRHGGVPPAIAKVDCTAPKLPGGKIFEALSTGRVSSGC